MHPLANTHAEHTKEKEKSAKADFLPSLSGNANFNYTGNPAELSVDIPSLNEPVSFQGRNSKYGASPTLAQPIYAGGAIKAGYDKAKKESELSHYEQIRITNNIITMRMYTTGIKWHARKWLRLLKN